MGFEGLLGNRRIKENLRAGISRGRMSHFYLICGPEGSGKHTLARLLAAAMVCAGEDRPCLGCPACRKILADTHPDLITVTDPEHKTVPVKQIRQVREDMFVRPNEADKKIYLFPQELNTEGQNTLLKVFEEPPSYGVFLLLAENPEKILTTVRSRCVELQLQSLSEAELTQALEKEFPDRPREELQAAISRSGGYLGQAKKLLEDGKQLDPQTEGFVKSFAGRDTMLLVSTLVPMEKWKRDRLIPVLEEWTELLQQAIVCRSGVQVLSEQARTLGAARSSAELLEAVRHLQKAVEYAQGNVSVGAVCGYLEWALR